MKASRPTLRVLIVDDDDDHRQMLEHILGLHGYAVAAAGSCAQARARAAAGALDMVICDIGLPDGDAVELMRELRRNYLVTTIGLTTHANPRDIARCGKAGVHALLGKPVAVNELIHMIQRLMIPPDMAGGRGRLVLSHGLGEAVAAGQLFLDL
ncbi:MAG: sensor hybrid histidine kinase [Phycisphaerales bacterium]|nr:sensor hybrid histidine kinase [Phycisphaerales bacterium]